MFLQYMVCYKEGFCNDILVAMIRKDPCRWTVEVADLLERPAYRRVVSPIVQRDSKMRGKETDKNNYRGENNIQQHIAQKTRAVKNNRLQISCSCSKTVSTYVHE